MNGPATTTRATAPRVARLPIPIDRRYLAPILVTTVLLAGQVGFGFLESWSRTALAIATAMIVELVLGRIFFGKWPHLASAYVSGISVGILVRSPEYWPYVVCSALAISSKYVIRVDGRHIFNPSNFAIVALLVLAADTVAPLSVQWGNNLVAMIVVWCFGAAIIASVGRFHITLTYVLSFVAFSYLRHLITGDPWVAEIAPITGPMYQLFIFFMITDPKTTVNDRRGQYAVAFLVAAVEFALRLLRFIHAPFYALFLVGPTANLIEIARTRRARRRAAGAQAVA